MTKLIKKIRKEKGDKLFFPGVQSAQAWNNFHKQRGDYGHITCVPMCPSYSCTSCIFQLISTCMYIVCLCIGVSVVAVNHVLFQYCNLTDYGCMKMM